MWAGSLPIAPTVFPLIQARPFMAAILFSIHRWEPGAFAKAEVGDTHVHKSFWGLHLSGTGIALHDCLPGTTTNAFEMTAGPELSLGFRNVTCRSSDVTANKQVPETTRRPFSEAHR